MAGVGTNGVGWRHAAAIVTATAVATVTAAASTTATAAAGPLLVVRLSVELTVGVPLGAELSE